MANVVESREPRVEQADDRRAPSAFDRRSADLDERVRGPVVDFS
jgi:hypothetical protein